MKKTGRRLRTEHLEVRAVSSLFSYTRVAVVVGKYGHSIVERNRLRRQLRELTRIRIIHGVEKADVVMRSLPSAYEATFDQLLTEVEEILRKLKSEASAQ